MTREEAIEILQGAIKKPNTKDGYLGQAIDMAIKALEQDTTDNDVVLTYDMYHELIADRAEKLEQESCVDAISRKAVLDATVKRNSIWNKITNSKGENLEEIISQLPSVTPKQKTGHWIYDDQIQNWICSECNETPKTIGYVGADDFMKEHFKYCNHCGAKMESEDCK